MSKLRERVERLESAPLVRQALRFEKMRVAWTPEQRRVAAGYMMRLYEAGYTLEQVLYLADRGVVFPLEPTPEELDVMRVLATAMYGENDGAKGLKLVLERSAEWRQQND